MLSLLSIVLLLFTLTVFVLESSTTIRWQEKAINIYNAAVQKSIKPMYAPEPWWTDNPFWVAYGVWKEDPYNWLSLLVSMMSYGFVLLRKHEETKRPHLGGL